MEGNVIGKIHSIETFGTVDGPGIRYVIFTQGCQFKCLYCHNPDTWEFSRGKDYNVKELVDDICKYKRYIEGITVSGGEPLLQIDFLIQLFTEVKKEGLTTCIDTNGGVFDKNNEALLDKIDQLLEVTDLVMLDIKHIDDEAHTKLTGKSNKSVLEFAKYLSEKNKDVWLRYVLVPTINDSDDIVLEWKAFADSLKNVKKIEVLPYHRLAISKYEKLGIEYPLKDIVEPTIDDIERVKNLLLIKEDI